MQPIGSNTANKHFLKACVCIQCVVQISDNRQGVAEVGQWGGGVSGGSGGSESTQA